MALKYQRRLASPFIRDLDLLVAFVLHEPKLGEFLDCVVHRWHLDTKYMRHINDPGDTRFGNLAMYGLKIVLKTFCHHNTGSIHQSLESVQPKVFTCHGE